MVVKKYFGKTTRDALRQVREELGADALILSNRPAPGGGIEIMAVADADVANLASSLSTSSSRHPPRNAPAQGNGAAVNRALARTYALPVEPLENPPPLRVEPPGMHPAAQHSMARSAYAMEPLTPPPPVAPAQPYTPAAEAPRASQRPQPAKSAPPPQPNPKSWPPN